MNEYEIHMEECFRLAKKAIGETSPNPYVGSIIVKDGEMIAEGFHARAGLDHAEVAALKAAQKDVAGATLICNLEPCCHTNKRTAPCVDAIIEANIGKVVIANLDPNPEVSGKGVKKLQSASIEVEYGVLARRGELLNEVFFTNMRKKRPFIHLKWAQTLDGKIATLKNSSKWITNEKSRHHVHLERSLYNAIMVGDQTIKHDNPSLSIRIGEKNECTKRIILNPRGDLEQDYKVFQDEFKEQTILVTERPSPHNVKQIQVPMNDQSFDLDSLLSQLYAQGICSIYVEGGMKTISHFIDCELYDRLSIYIAPKLLGPGLSLNTQARDHMSEAIELFDGEFTSFGHNLLFESQRNECLQD
ncbi:MAG: riboflavin biosynthesis protein RibD [Halobacteriovoraceae bacterium]|nr:riboflavin biosynthesis protein RibD [Halobacteriovoraceae bacterium]|tara:strand:- start:35476 stop:36552 length:1077 start_codon:yes stop_codon:yes gene_type:complete